MGVLTDIQKVLDRLGYREPELTDDVINRFITDAEAFIFRETDRTSFVSGTELELASATAADIAALYCIVRLEGGRASGLNYVIDDAIEVDKTSQQENRIRLAFELKVRAQRAVPLLRAQEDNIPGNSTYTGQLIE